MIEDVFSVAIDRMQRKFAPMLNQVNAWEGYELPDAAAKLVIYRAFIEDDLPAPKHLAKDVHRHYFEPEYEEFKPRTMWSLSNAFTSAQGTRSVAALQSNGEARAVPRPADGSLSGQQVRASR